MKPILITQHGEEAEPGRFGEYLEQRNIPFLVVRTYGGDSMPRSASDYAGICSLGGIMSVNDDLPWIADELALMMDADERGVPVIGHCLGGQLLAKALGAPVTRNAIKEIGWSVVEVDDGEIARDWLGDASTLELFQWHGDTFAVPRDGRRFLTNRWCANQAFVVERGSFAHLGMQFHVEMTPALVQSWVTSRGGAEEIDEAIGLQQGAGVQSPADMLRDLARRTARMNAIADRLYERWLRGAAC